MSSMGVGAYFKFIVYTLENAHIWWFGCVQMEPPNAHMSSNFLSNWKVLAYMVPNIFLMKSTKNSRATYEV